MPVGGARPGSGRPKGGSDDKPFRDAIAIAVREYKEVDKDGKKTKVRKLRLLAEQLIDKGLDGDVTALKEIGDRIDGKPSQQQIHTGPNDGPMQVVGVNYQIVDPEHDEDHAGYTNGESVQAPNGTG